MCDVLLFGSAAMLNPMTGAVTTAATSGLLGTAGAFGIGSALSTLGTAFGAFGSLSSGYGESRAHQWDAGIMTQNAEIARRKAVYDERLERTKNARILAAGRVDVAKSGVTMFGSPLDVMAQSASDAELEALSIRYGGNLNVANANAQSNLAKLEARQAMQSSYFGAGTRLLTGGAAIYGKPLLSLSA